MLTNRHGDLWWFKQDTHRHCLASGSMLLLRTQRIFKQQRIIIMLSLFLDYHVSCVSAYLCCSNANVQRFFNQHCSPIFWRESTCCSTKPDGDSDVFLEWSHGYGDMVDTSPPGVPVEATQGSDESWETSADGWLGDIDFYRWPGCVFFQKTSAWFSQMIWWLVCFRWLGNQSKTGWWFGCHEFYFPIDWESHHPNWRTHIVQRGFSPTTNQKMLGTQLRFSGIVLGSSWVFYERFFLVVQNVKEINLDTKNTAVLKIQKYWKVLKRGKLWFGWWRMY